MSDLSELSGAFFGRKIDKKKEDIDCLKRSLNIFCKTGKKEDAFCVYFCFCEIFELFGHGYGTIKKLLEFLSDHEYHSGELLIKHRDHYSHSVYVFALGLAIYSNDKNFEKIISGFYKKGGFSDTEFLRLWGMTALFHDIGYPFQLAHEQIKAYVGELWKEGNNPYVSYENMTEILKLNEKLQKESRFNYLTTIDELLAYGINYRLGYPLHIVLQELNKRYENKPDYMDHGYFSAVLLANRLKQSDVPLTDSLLDVLTAIALHNNLNRYDLKEKIDKTAISPYKHPLAYLLILCDELQDWDRTPFGSKSKKDPLAWKVDLQITNEELVINYYFDSFTVSEVEVKEIEDKSKPNGKAYIISPDERVNKNVETLNKEGEKNFVNKICALIEQHTKISAYAKEEVKEKKVRLFASSDKFVNLCDFARAIHISYQSVNGGPDFEDLPLEFKLSNIEQAKSYDDKLELINCFYSDKELDYPIVNGFESKRTDGICKRTRDDLGFLAREEHIRWVREKLEAGWKFGKDYETREERNSKKIHRDIIPYDFLPEEEKAKDELMIKNMVPFLYKFGNGVRIYSYRTGLKPVLDIAGCGHRTIPMKNDKLKEQIKQILSEYQKEYHVIVRTNFAFGADQLIAQCANELGITLKAAIPFGYEDYIAKIKEDAKKYSYKFTYEDEMNMRHLLAQCVSCKVKPDNKFGYLEASKYILNKSKKLIAIWDGVETILEDENGNPINQGGTWHNIYIAKNSRGLKDEDIHIIKCER